MADAVNVSFIQSINSEAKAKQVPNENVSKEDKMPLGLKARIVTNFLFPLSLVSLLCALLSTKVDESSPSYEHAPLPHLLVNSSGSTMMANAWQRSLVFFSNFIAHQQSGFVFDYDYMATSSAGGQADFLGGYSLFGATDTDLGKADWKYYLPDDGSGVNNASQYTDPRAPAHLGNILMPVMGGAIGIIYNIPGFPAQTNPLTLNASILGDIICGATVWWNDTAIQALNPGVTLPREKIRVIGRGDPTVTNTFLGMYLSKYSVSYKTLFGLSPSPKWSSSVTLGYSAIELVYILSSLQYSITYAAMESIVQAGLLGINTDKARLMNANQTSTQPSNDDLIKGMEVVAYATPFSRHNYASIFDLNNPGVYPISLLSFALLREHYFYNKFGTQTDCDRIKALVYFLYFYFTDRDIQLKNIDYGGVPIAGRLLDKNLNALGLITCNRQNVMAELSTDLNRVDFYKNKTETYEWDFAISFWDNKSKFTTSPISSSLYIIFYITLIASNAIPFFVNMIKYVAHNQVQVEIHKETQDSNVSSLANMSDEDELEIEEDKDDADIRKAGKVSFTLQNRLAIITQFIACFQILYLCMTRSVVIQHNIYLDVVSYLGLIPDLYPYYVILNVTVSAWILGMIYTTYFYGILEKYSPKTVFSLGHFHGFLAEFLPNYAVIFYNPSVELLTKVFDCRLSTETWEYTSSFHEGLCWKGRHWTMAIISLVLVCTFTNFVVRYSKILKNLRKHFDFTDKEWCIYVDSVAKTFILILYFNIPNNYFLGSLFCLLIVLSLCSWIGKPNKIFWYNYFRGSMYLYSSLVCLVLFVLELKVSNTDYIARHNYNETISLAILGTTLGLCVCSYVLFASKYKAGLTKAELKQKEEELKKFFAAFCEEEVEADKLNQTDLDNQNKESGSNSNMSLAKSVSGSLHVINGGFSMNQWRNFESAIDSAKKINMLSAKEARAIKLAIRMEDPMISIIFDRSNRNFNAFIESLKLKVWQILSKTGAKNIKSTFLRPSNVQIDHVSLQGNAESDPVSGSLPRPVQQQHVGIQPLRSRQLSPLPRPVSTAPVIEVSAQTLKQEGHENISQDNLPHN